MLTTKQIKELIESGNESEVPEDELRIYYENMAARENWQLQGVKNLYNAVCHEAVLDYKKARKRIGFCGVGHDKEAERAKADIEKFFGSDFFKDVSGCQDPKKVIKAVEDDMKKNAMKTIIR